MATSNQNINIVVSATGGVTVVRSLQQIAAAAQSGISPLQSLQSALRGVMGALAIRQLADWADQWTSAANKVAVFTKSQEETNVVLDALFNIAQRVRQPMNEIVNLYHRLSIGAKDLGTSTNQNLQFTENIGKALAVQGTSANTARGALLQLSQAMAMGRIRAQEFNSMNENLPLVLLTVAKNVDGANGSISRLRQMMLNGKLTSREFFEAFMKGGPELSAMFDKTDKTFGQAMTVLTDGISRYLGTMNQSLGISNKFYEITKFISNNLDTIGKLLFVVGAAVLGAFAPTLVTMFATALGVAAAALGRLTVLLLANPFVLIAAAVAAVIAFGDSWNAGIDNITSVKDVFRALMEFIIEGLHGLAEFFGFIWDEIGKIVSAHAEGMNSDTANATAGMTGSFNGFFDDTGAGFAGLVRGVAKTFDAIGGLILGIIIFFGRAFGGLPDVIGAAFGLVYNAIVGWMEKATNVVISGINAIRTAVGGQLLETVKFEKMNVDKATFEKYGQSIGSSIDAGFEMQGNALLKTVDGVFGRASEIAKARAASTVKQGVNLDITGDPSDPMGKTKKPKKNTEMDKLTTSLRTLLDRIDPASGALLEMAKAQDTLNKAVDKGLITEGQRQNYLILLKNHYRDIIDPLGAVNREMDKQVGLLSLDVRARERQAEFLKIQQDLFQKGKILNEEEITALQRKLLVNQQLNESSKIQDALLAESVEKRRTFATTLTEINKLMNDPSSGFNKGDATAKLQGELPDLFAGTQEAIDLRMTQFTQMYAQIDMMRQMDLISEQTASQMKLKVVAMESEQRLTQYSQLFGGIAALSSSSNRKVAAIGKAAAMTQATIDGVLAVQKALGSAPYPINIAMAAVVGVQAAANVAKIASTNTAFATGGDFMVGGSGGVDSQMVAFRASPGEKVAISTPQQVRHGTATKEGASSGEPPIFKPNIVNFTDKSLLAAYLATSDGESAILNVMQNNPNAVRSAMGGR